MTAVLDAATPRPGDHEDGPTARAIQAGSFLTFPPYDTVGILNIGPTLAASSPVAWVERRPAGRT